MAVVLITGASSGFGKLTSLEFARSGDRVYASMRRPESGSALREAASAEGLDLRIQRLDVTDRQSVAQAIEQLLSESHRIDVLVNNAGIHCGGAVEDMPEADLRLVMETNFFGALNVSRRVLPAMRAQASGHIIMVSSLGGLVGRATDAAYCASKFALEGASESLRYEVERFGIKVAIIEPGAFRTEIAENAIIDVEYQNASPYRALLEFRSKKMQQACRDGNDPQEVAKLIVAVARDPAPRLRYVTPEYAQEIAGKIATLDDEGRAELLRKAAHTEWWSEGRDKPD